MRSFFLHKAAIAVYILLILSLFSLQVIRGAKYRELSNKNCIRLIPQGGSRGKILDANGMVLVGNNVSYDVICLPQDRKKDKPFVPLANLLKCDPDQLQKNFRQNYSAPSIPVVIAQDIGLKKAAELEEKRFDLDNVIVQTNTSRFYPFGSLGCHIFGYISEIDRWRLTKLEDYGYKTKDMVGFGGVEEKYDYYLRQEDGGLSVEVDHQGRFVRTLGYKPGEQGRDLQLTVDYRVQRIAEDSLDGKGCALVMDANTGAVLAMVSKPGFQPSAFVKRPRPQSVGEYFTSSSAPLLNRAISCTYPPGSVFKMLVACAALETGKIDADTVFECKGGLVIGRRLFQCWDTHDRQDIISAIAHSCDVFFYRTGLAVGGQTIHDYAVRFGFSRPSGIELPYEAGGFVPNPVWKRLSQFKQWYDGDTANLSIGQGELLVSPLQVCRMTAVFANGGRLVTPFIIKAIDTMDVSRQHMRAVDLHLKERTLRQIRKGMRKAVESGTCSVLASLPVEVAGKTGTAQISGKEADNHGWFTGFFPYAKPRYVISVFLEKGGHGTSAAAVARDVIEKMCEDGLVELPVKTTALPKEGQTKVQ
ncbi:MAG: penicillin-binding protein 2 [Deltaproteobacteria bacterium]